MGVARALAPNLPFLRRYARTLTGSQSSGDAYVRATLTALLDGDQPLLEQASSRVGLYRLFHLMWIGTAKSLDVDDPEPNDRASGETRLRALPPSERAALLLTAVESFSMDEAALILGVKVEEVERSVVEAQAAIEGNLTSKVLIIEDEPLIALDLENIVSELGHQVVAKAHTSRDAVSQAHSNRPELVLADINLGEGGSGIDAVREILNSFDIPVIFITAYPEKLLTGERPEPTYLISKPFLRETIQTTVGQALFFHQTRRKAA